MGKLTFTESGRLRHALEDRGHIIRQVHDFPFPLYVPVMQDILQADAVREFVLEIAQ